MSISKIRYHYRRRHRHRRRRFSVVNIQIVRVIKRMLAIISEPSSP